MVVMDDLPGKTAVKGKVGSDQSDCGGGGEGGAAGKGLAQPSPQIAGVRLGAPGIFGLQMVACKSWPGMLCPQKSQAGQG